MRASLLFRGALSYVRALTRKRCQPPTTRTTGRRHEPQNHRAPIARWAAGAKRWAASVAVATYVVGVACLALSVYEAETARAARLRVARAGVVVWHGAQRRDARAHTIMDAHWQASPAFIIMEEEEEACAPRAVPAPKRRAHSAVYSVRHSTAPTMAAAVPVEPRRGRTQ